MLRLITALLITALVIVTATYLSLPEATGVLQNIHASEPAQWLLGFMREQQFPLETFGPFLIIFLLLATFLLLAVHASEVSHLKKRREDAERQRDEAAEEITAANTKLGKAEAEIARLKGEEPKLPPAPKLVVPKLVMPKLDIDGQLSFLEKEAARLEGRISADLETNDGDDYGEDWRARIDALVARVGTITATSGVHRDNAKIVGAIGEIERLVEASASVDASVARIRGGNASETLDNVRDDADDAQVAIEDAAHHNEAAARLMTRLQEIAGQLKNLEGDNGLLATVRQLEQLSARLRTRIENLPSTEDIDGRLDQIGEEADTLEGDFDKSSSAVDKLRVQITGLRTRLNAIAAQIGFNERPVNLAVAAE